MDWNFMTQYADLYLEAAALTVRIAVIGTAGAFLVGFLCSVVRFYKVSVFHRLAGSYVELSRNTPLLIQLFFLYYGLPKIGIVLSAEACAITGLVFQGGGYMAETFRSGLEAVAKTQEEAALSLGLKRWQGFWFVLLPQAVAVTVPAFGANVIFLLKETSVFSIVALGDLMHVAKDLIGLYYKTDEALLMLVASYLVILVPVSAVFTWIERRVRYAGYGN